MNYEKDIINTILERMPVTDKHLSKFFESDSEVLEIEGGKFLYSIDTFSDEDYLYTSDPYHLGRNLAIATITDIFASGGKLLFFSSSLTISNHWNKEFISELSRGIGDIIRACGAFFAGGDLGTSEKFSFTGVAFGKTNQEISRRGCSVGDSIYLTGKMGAGNLQAARSIFKIINQNSKTEQEFILHLKEAEIISKFANTCIDTSDGLIKSLQIISDINESGFEVMNIPYLLIATELIESINFPKELLLMGECGEYELLFTVPKNKVELFDRILCEDYFEIRKIGTISEKDKKIINEENYYIDYSNFEIHARSFNSINDYLSGLVKYITNNKHKTSGVLK